MKARVILLIIGIWGIYLYLSPNPDNKNKLKAYFHYFIRALTGALILYWIFFIIGSLIMEKVT